MTAQRTLSLLLAGLTLTVSRLAAAQEPVSEPTPERPADGVHWELTLGFIGGLRDESVNGFVFHDGPAGELPGGSALVAPFAGAPYTNAIVSGPATELRVVTN